MAPMPAQILKTVALMILVVATGGQATSCSKKAAEVAATAGGSTQTVAQAPTAATPPSAEAEQEARAIFAQRCTMCHGLSGHGDGPAAAGLQPRPRDYSDPAWQRATGDQEIALVIVGGGPAVGKSLMMPANPDLKDRPEVVAGLVHLVRSFAQP